MPGSDKLVHFLSFVAVSAAALAFCRTGRQLLLAGLFCGLAGIGLEVAQGFTATRLFEWGDVAANLGGTAVGLGSAFAVLALLRGYRRRVRPVADGRRGRVSA